MFRYGGSPIYFKNPPWKKSRNCIKCTLKKTWHHGLWRPRLINSIDSSQISTYQHLLSTCYRWIFLVWIWCPNQDSGDPEGSDFFLGDHPKVTRLQTSDYYRNYRLLYGASQLPSSQSNANSTSSSVYPPSRTRLASSELHFAVKPPRKSAAWNTSSNKIAAGVLHSRGSYTLTPHPFHIPAPTLWSIYSWHLLKHLFALISCWGR